MNCFIKYLFLLLLVNATYRSNAQDTIHWQTDCKLVWEDFQGVVEDSSSYTAMSSLVVSYNLSCTEKSFTYIVSCFFNRKESWVKQKSAALLKHEKIHFDIAELYARKLRRFFKNYHFNESTIKNDAETIYEQLMNERTKIDNQYDRETNFSNNTAKQAYWSRKIARELKELEESK